MRLSFDSIDEVRDFVKGLKGTRGGKGGDSDDAPSGQAGGAPALLQPPAGATQTFAPQGQAFQPQGQTFLAGPNPEVAALVARIVTRIDGLISSGSQPADSVLGWFRTQCGAEAAGATLDQIKQVFLPKGSVPALTEMAKLVGA